VKVAELMQTNLKTIGVDATIADAVVALTEAQVSSLPVIDRYGRAVGVLSTRDILAAERACETRAQREQLFERTRVLEAMAPWAPTADPDADIHEAAQQMLYLNVPRLFVEFEGALVGVISQTDIVAAVATARV
jgi:CBS domain-containing protein